MKYLTVDFGSTYTKLSAIDADRGEVVATAAAFTTIDTDVRVGFRNALARLEESLGEPFAYDELLCCSSAAGGLKMVALGLVPELTSKAARLAASSAGAKVVKTYAFEISKQEQEEIYRIDPDLVLLCGGTDGGNKEVIVANARRLCAIRRNFSVIVAGNKSASYELEEVFATSDKNYVITDNVMPEFNRLNIGPAKEKIKELFISRIIEAKGLTSVQDMTPHRIIPTPLAVMNGCELFSKGTKKEAGVGDLLAIDIGGATTDVYSMTNGTPTIDGAVTKGLPEPYAKRTVEGDLGMRYSLSSLADELDLDAVANAAATPRDEVEAWVRTCTERPDTLAESGSAAGRIEEELARGAIRLAVERHCGIYQTVYTPCGQLFALTGKDLADVAYVIGIGGAIIHSEHPDYILEGAKAAPTDFTYAKPQHPAYKLDRRYIFASMGLLSAVDPELALRIMKAEIV